MPRDSDVYICGPALFKGDMKAALAAMSVAPERMPEPLDRPANGNLIV